MSSSDRFFVYDVRTQCEDFVASFSNSKDAHEWGQKKFGENLFVSDAPLHGVTLKKGRSKPVKL